MAEAALDEEIAAVAARYPSATEQAFSELRALAERFAKPKYVLYQLYLGRLPSPEQDA